MGLDVPLGLRAHPARPRRPARLPTAVLDLRPGRRDPPDRLRDPRPRPRQQALHPARRARHDQPLEERARRSPRSCGRGRNTSSTASTPRCTRSTRRRLHAAGAMDFDDLLVNTVVLFRQHPDVLEEYRERFQHVLVDEYQDTNVAQNELVLLLAGDHGNVTVVGDHDQSVYRFRGADLRNIVQFEDAFAGRRDDDRPRPELPQHADDPRRRQRRDRQQHRPQAEAPVDRRRARRPDRPLLGRGRDRRGALRRRHRPPTARHRRRQLARDRRALPHQRPEPGRRGVVDAQRRAVQGGRRHAVLRPPGDPRRDGVPAGRRQPRRRGERQAHPQRAQARDRRHERRQARPLRGDDRPRLRRCAAPRRRSRGHRPGATRASPRS